MLSTRRYISSDAFPFRKDADGKPLCRWCGNAVKPPRRSWCSQDCVDEFLAASSGSGLRSVTFKRDKGLCAACGCDTEKIQRIIEHALKSYETEDGMWSVSIHGRRVSDVWRVFGALGFNDNQSLWEADHIVEVCNGGETCLGNTQTLCVPCHKLKTKKMHEDRARARRSKDPLPEPATQLVLMR